MGYSCPVCSDPQADGVHLANHLAITAMARGGDHERYLDEAVAGWREMSEDELADAVTEEAGEADYPQVFEDTTDHDHRQSPAESVPFEADIPDRDDQTDEVLEEAMELTRKRHENTDEDEPETE